MSQNLRTRLFLALTLALTFSFLWSKWQEQFSVKPQSQQVSASDTVKVLGANSLRPETAQTTPSVSMNGTQKTSGEIRLQNNALGLHVDVASGDITGADLLQYPESIKNKTPVELLYQSGTGQYIAETGFLGLNALNYSVLSKTAQSVTLKAKTEGLSFLKTITLKPSGYEVAVNYVVKNEGRASWNGQLFGQLVRTPPDKHSSLYSRLATFTGAAISNQNQHYQSVSFRKLEKDPLNSAGDGGFAAMVQHYFVSAWIPQTAGENQFYAKDYGQQNFAAGSLSSSVTVAKGETKTFSGKFYIGPTLTPDLQAAAPFLDLTIDYGWLWFIAKYLFVVLAFIEKILGNWGWSIVAITLLIKIVFFPLSNKSYLSMAKMRLLQPKVQKLQKQHAGDRVALQKAMMELYSKEKVNPLGGCLPFIIQIPIFIALYWMLMASVELRQAPFLWVKDLSLHDPYYILPLLTGALMLIQQLLGPKPPDPVQRYVMLSMPILFTFFMFNLPAGLGLYMVINIGFSILHQSLMTKIAIARLIARDHKKASS